MDCSYLGHGECDDYSVTPVLAVEDRTLRYCEEVPEFYPRLPTCQKPVTYCCKEKPDSVEYCNEKKPQKVMYCCEKKPKKIMYCYEEKPQKVYCGLNEPPRAKCCSLATKREHPSHHSTKSCCNNSESNKHDHQSLESYNSCCDDSESKPIKTKYIMPCYRYEDGRIERYVPTRYGRLPLTAYRNNGIQDQMHGYRGAVRYLCANHHPYYGNCVHTVVEPMRTWYPKITQEVRALPVTAFKRNGLQDQDHSKTLGTANFLVRCPRDVAVECDVYVQNIKVADPAKVPPYYNKCSALVSRGKPIEKNQPTLLMRRACEIAYGEPPRIKPFVVSSYHADPDHEVRRFHSEDEKGNCCFHFERNKSEYFEPAAYYPEPCRPISACVSSPGCEYVECRTVNLRENPSCCYYCN